MKKVLIFDDDEDILELCSFILQNNGFETKMETSCRDIIAKIGESNPDVILMDNWIPDTGGIKASQLIKNTASTRHIPVVFFSANSNIEKISKDANADYYLQKPFDISELELVILQAINGTKEN